MVSGAPCSEPQRRPVLVHGGDLGVDETEGKSRRTHGPVGEVTLVSAGASRPAEPHRGDPFSLRPDRLDERVEFVPIPDERQRDVCRRDALRCAQIVGALADDRAARWRVFEDEADRRVDERDGAALLEAELLRL